MARNTAVQMYNKAFDKVLRSRETPVSKRRAKHFSSLDQVTHSQSPETETRLQSLQAEVEKLKKGRDKIQKLRILNEEKGKQLDTQLHELNVKEQRTLKEIDQWKVREKAKWKTELRERFKIPDSCKLRQVKDSYKQLKTELQSIISSEEASLKQLNDQIATLQQENDDLRRLPKGDPDFDSFCVATPKQASPVKMEPDGFAVSIADNRFWTQDATVEEQSPQLTSSEQVVKDQTFQDGNRQITYADGRKEILFPNNVRKEIHPDGFRAIHFANGDVKQEFPDKRTVYIYAESKTTQINFPNGDKVFKFCTGQIETHRHNGSKEVIFPDGSKKVIGAN